MRVLLVEDEPLVAMLTEDMLNELGHTVVAVANRVDTAQRLVGEGGFDLVILDQNLGGVSVAPVACHLLADGVPFVVASGYAQVRDLEEGSAPLLQKPFQLVELETAIDKALGARAQA